MKKRMNKITKALVALTFCTGGAALAQSAYAGQEQRSLKALSPQEVSGLLAGAGLGYARTAELNGYPGPLHVLELADPLGLSASQRVAATQLMTEHKQRARALGAELVNAEDELEQLFSKRTATLESIELASRRVGLLQGQLRAEHLKTHVDQTALLSEMQIRQYSVLRGYVKAPSASMPAETTTPHHGMRHPQ